MTTPDARSLLEERAARTTAVCQELERSDGDFDSGRVRRAAGALQDWLDRHFPSALGSSYRGGLDEMVVPAGSERLIREIHAGAAVCDSLAVTYSADTFREMENDAEDVARRLVEWRRVVVSLSNDEATRPS